MPLGFERLNERKSRPNAYINFIRPLPGPSETYAQDFLERVAAICMPIMKDNYIAVMALEEHAFNREFVGRNFNAGEVIQLVLRGPGGEWLSFKFVQMVMMHELAHCKQMNHSGAFWQVRNAYAEQLRKLWDKNYHGEGLWGRGQTLLSGNYESDSIPEAVRNVASLCGGTYRSSGRKRKRKSKQTTLSYAERKQRRIMKRFGQGGVTLGADEDVRSQLEQRGVDSKPRVAGSARGRELRAAAALARFEADKIKDEVQIKQEPDSDYESESDVEYAAPSEAAMDTDGSRMTDGRGKALVNVCGAEDPDSADVQHEMKELLAFGFTRKIVPRKAMEQQQDDAVSTKENASAGTSQDLRCTGAPDEASLSTYETAGLSACPDRTKQERAATYTNIQHDVAEEAPDVAERGIRSAEQAEYSPNQQTQPNGNGRGIHNDDNNMDDPGDVC